MCWAMEPSLGETHLRYGWTGLIYGTKSGSAAINDLATDDTGSVIIIGDFSGTVDFDATQAEDLRRWNGGRDIFVTKFQADGSYGWTYAVGSGNGGSGDDDEASRAVVAPSGDVLIAGHFKRTVDFDPGERVDLHTSGLQSNSFVTRLAADGEYLWTRSFQIEPMAVATAVAWGLASDSDGNLVLSGDFGGTVDFDPGPGVDSRSLIGRDLFLTKLTSDGSYVWTKTFGGSGNDLGASVACDRDDNILMTGVFRGAGDFDPGPDADWHVSAGPFGDIFLTKFEPDGTYVWTRALTADFSDNNRARVVVDDGGAAYLTGYFTFSVDFDPTEGVDLRSPQGDGSLWIIKIAGDGSYGWTYSIGGTGIIVGVDLVVTDHGLLVTGYFTGAADFDAGAGVVERTAIGPGPSGDCFLLSLSRDGLFQSVRTWGGIHSDVGRAVAMDAAGNVFLAGLFRPSSKKSVESFADADPSCGVDERMLTYPGGANFITKLVHSEAGDFDNDGDVDLLDAARMQNCFTGPSDDLCGPPCAACASGCDAFDVLFDNAIDTADVSMLMPLLTGPS